MNITVSVKDVKFEFMRGKGPGGQHKNKTDSACRVTHVPTGTTAYADTRSQHQSKKIALARLDLKLIAAAKDAADAKKKADRDRRIKEAGRVRTYDCITGVVTDHRTQKRSTVKNILKKGNLDDLR